MARIQNVSFTNRDGHLLAGRLNLPVGPHRGSAVFAHCFTFSKDTLAAVRVSQGLAERGIAVLRFDFTGLGQSDGDFASSGFVGNLSDLEDACQWLADEYHAPDLLIGHSLGGAAVLALAEAMPHIKGIACIGAPAVASHVLHLFDGATSDHDADRLAVSIGGRPFEVQTSFLEDLKKRTSLDHIGRLRADLLILHAPQDAIVGIENAAEIFTAAKHPKSFVSLDKANHLLTDKKDVDFTAAMIAAWASRLVEGEDNLPTAKEGEVMVSSSPDGPFAHNIAAGAHLMRADEPVDIPGGLDSGAAPYDFLIAGLGACTAMTLRMYAARKKWPLEGVHVLLRHEKRHGQDGIAASGSGAALDFMTREITIHGPLDDTQIARLLEIADKCPVHRSLEAGVRVETRLAD